MMLQHGFHRKVIGIVDNIEQPRRRQFQRGSDRVRRGLANHLLAAGRCNRYAVEMRQSCHLGTRPFAFFNQRTQINFSPSVIKRMLRAVLLQADIQLVQMVRTQFSQLDVSDCRKDALTKVQIQLNCAVLCARVLFQVDNIRCILRKGLAVVRLITLFDCLLELERNALCLPLGTLL